MPSASDGVAGPSIQSMTFWKVSASRNMVDWCRRISFASLRDEAILSCERARKLMVTSAVEDGSDIPQLRSGVSTLSTHRIIET